MIKSISFDNIQKFPRCLTVVDHFGISANNFSESCGVEKQKYVAERNSSEIVRLKIENQNSERQNSRIKGSRYNRRITTAIRFRIAKNKMMESSQSFTHSFSHVRVLSVRSVRRALRWSAHGTLRLGFHSPKYMEPKNQAFEKPSYGLNVGRNFYSSSKTSAHRVRQNIIKQHAVIP